MGMGMGMGMRGGMMGRRFRSKGRSPLLEPIYDGFAVNGKVSPHIAPLIVKRGERIKLRLMNPSSSTVYDLQLAGHPLTITHADGRPIVPIRTDLLRIGMGERYDMEFMADNPDFWLLAANGSRSKFAPALTSSRALKIGRRRGCFARPTVPNKPNPCP